MKKILTLLIILTIAISCLSIVSADNNTTNDTLETAQEDDVVEDNANYILVTSISDKLIEFSDGFSGFCMDLTKKDIKTDDKFTQEPTGNSKIENYIKLAIIECYKQKRESDIGTVIASFADGSYASSSDDVIKAVLSSSESIGNHETVKIDNTTEATFNFELLKSADDEKSDCLGYTVSLVTVENEDVLAASNDDDANAIDNGTDNTTKTEDNIENNTDNTTKTEDNIENNTDNTTKTDEKSDNETEPEKENKTSKDSETVINETNKTIINKTNTVIINQNNTTTITQKNIKHINNTTHQTPHNETAQEKLLKTVGNPIFILIVVIAIIAIVTVAIRRKG
jgi:hypothetical protein